MSQASNNIVNHVIRASDVAAESGLDEIKLSEADYSAFYNALHPEVRFSKKGVEKEHIMIEKNGIVVCRA